METKVDKNEDFLIEDRIFSKFLSIFVIESRTYI